MATISSLGTGSGLDLAGLVDKLVAAEGAPAAARLDRNEANIQAKLSAFGSLKGALSSFQSSIAGLAQFSTFQKKSVSTTSTTDLFTVSASSSAIPGTYNVEVTNVAKAHSLATSVGQFNSNTDAIGTGTLTISFGTVTYAGDDVTAFNPNANKSAINVTIDSSNNTLQGVRDAINNANGGVTASIINNGSDFQLVLTSDDTGIVNGLQIDVDEGLAPADNVDMTGLSRLAFNKSAASVTNMENTVSANDAGAIINGISITSASNTLTDVIEGITLNLLQQSAAGVTVGVSVSNDTVSTKTTIESFISSYNNLTATLNTLTDVNVSANTAGLLVADAGVRGIENQIRRIISSSVPGLTGSIQSILDLGVKTSSDGTLTIDSTKLQTAIDNNFDEISALFTRVGVPSDSLINYVSSTSSTTVGSYAVNVTQAATQGALTGDAAIANLVIGTGNDNFAVKVNGVQSGTITLTNKTYLSNADLVAEMQSHINADSALVAAGINVTVSLSGSKLVFTSDTYGSASTVELTSVENAADLGLTTVTANDGVDVAGTIGGVTATGSGQLLTGTGIVSGLQLQVSGGGTGNRGTVNFTSGFAQQLDDLLTGFLASDGIIETRTQGFNDSVGRITEQRDALEFRLSKIEARAIAQFSALDILIAQLKVTSDFLTQQLAALPPIGSSKR